MSLAPTDGVNGSAAALMAAHQGRFDELSATAWVEERLALLTERAAGGDVRLSVSSGCAAAGAATHVRTQAQAAQQALARWHAGTGPRCEACDEVIAFDRLESLVAAVRCASCAPRTPVDTRWCR